MGFRGDMRDDTAGFCQVIVLLRVCSPASASTFRGSYISYRRACYSYCCFCLGFFCCNDDLGGAAEPGA